MEKIKISWSEVDITPEKGGHYSAYVSSGTTDHVGGNMLVRTTLEKINKMFR